MFSRIGSILAPFLVREVGAVSPSAPVFIFGLISLLAGLVTLLLPETRGRVSPDTIEEGEALCRDSRLGCCTAVTSRN